VEKLPVYNIRVNEDLSSNEGIEFVSLVDFPAIEVNWVAFGLSSKAPQKLYFDKDQQMLYGPILIPNKPIYRFAEDIGEYYVNFPESEVIKLTRKLQAQGKTINLNYQHQKDSQLPNAVIQEIWLTGKNDKSKDFGFDLPVNSAMVGVHIGDQKFWAEEVKSGNVKGFSIEGWLDMELKSIKNMSQQKYVTATTTDGVVINCDSETISEGVDVYTLDEAGNKAPVVDGTYQLENGSTITVLAGKVTSIVEGAPIDPAMEKVIQDAAAPAIAAAVQSAIEKVNKEWSDKFEAFKVEISNKPGSTPTKVETPAPSAFNKLNPVERVAYIIDKHKKK